MTTGLGSNHLGGERIQQSGNDPLDPSPRGGRGERDDYGYVKAAAACLRETGLADTTRGTPETRNRAPGGGS